jgi:hypothetical protein
MEQIKSLYDGINFVTIPNVILQELRKHSNERSFTSTRDKNGKFITTYGEKIEPRFMRFSDYNFYLNEKYYAHLIKSLESGLCYDEDKNKLNPKNIDLFYQEYGKGFNKGYNEFENSLKNTSSLFSVTNEQISFKVYSRIKEHWTTNKFGAFQLIALSEFNPKTKKFETGVQNLDFGLQLTKENCFESGFNGGEFYKAWEIILNNPTIFEPIFLANAENEVKQPEPEAIDLSDTTATEKIIYLHKLGVIDFLRTQQPFISVPDKVSQVISAFTGINIDTVRPMVRPIINNDFEDRKNPLNSQKPVNKVTKQLIQIGFNVDETI